jgi:catechol 2,3-dioxygenase
MSLPVANLDPAFRITRTSHVVLTVKDLDASRRFYTQVLGLIVSAEEADALYLRGVFLQRKGNPHDIVFFNSTGPRLHHFAFLAAEGQQLLRACDIAGELGYGSKVERGPGRHGPGHAMFVYFRDPDGHRVELFNTHYQVMDIENEPVGWDPADANVSFPWGYPARAAWFEEATDFSGVAVSGPQ